ncbi:hypothetical protein [Paenibacillus sp. CF384]|uniref:hypothetical protein n=1 Tax=Paenibacillus sp. CF384 TaxID=1884382 RepID=UPI00089AE6FF|nr:hypothetical protein [Paenibacillus sp. CF384]SDX84783.1 hypothetical protein SAMN05518855_102439 [Paenibacillus sp. CF384]
MVRRDSNGPSAESGKVGSAGGADAKRFNRKLLAALGFIVRMMFFRHPEALR